ncbi:MAG: glycosyltransferase family 4 protein [Mariniphaga sp.]
MKILFVTQYFYPEEFRGNDIAFDWSVRGNEVTVITAIPNYPSGKYHKGYGLFTRRKEIVNGVLIIRIPVIPRGKDNSFLLIFNYLSFAILGTIYAIYLSIRKKFDLIFVQQLSPVTMALPGIVVKKIQKIPLYLWVLDLWPESIASASHIRNKYILSFFEKIVKFIYLNSDEILISSTGFETSIRQKINFNQKIIYFPNWAEEIFNDANSSCQIPDLPDGFIIMFAGNIGEAQDFENVMKVSLLLKGNVNIKFVFLGDGRKKRWIDNFCMQYGLQNTVYCLGRYPLAMMPSFFKKADLLLVSLKDEPIFNLTLPAKIQAYMTSAKPIVGMINGEGSDIIKVSQCGLCSNAGDYIGLAENIQKLAMMDDNELRRLGSNGQEFALIHYNKKKLLDQLYFGIIKKT